jgi:arginine repressor
MHVANIVVKTQPGKARSVADLIGHLQGMALRKVEGDQRVLATWSVPEDQHLEPEGVSEVLQAMSGDILEVGLLDEEERS